MNKNTVAQYFITFTFGCLLGFNGMSFMTWQYWVALTLFFTHAHLCYVEGRTK